jgi:resuscitation-promoting factor RpfB
MAAAGADWQTSPATQIRCGLGYIAARYGTACMAWAHEEADSWY